MTTTVKAEAIMRKISQVFTKLMPTYYFAASVDTEGYPALFISQSVSPVRGQQNLLIRVRPDNLVFKNAVELAQENFCPHNVEVITEGIQFSEFDPGITFIVLNSLNAMKMHAGLVKSGCVYKFYVKPGSENALISLADFTIANLQFIVNPSVYDLDTAQ